MSSMVRIPPPTVNGMKTTSAVRRDDASMISRPSWLAVMSRKTKLIGPLFFVAQRRPPDRRRPAEVEEIRPLDELGPG